MPCLFKNRHDPFIPVPFWPLLSGDKIDLTTYYPTKASSKDSGAGIQNFVHFTLYAINSLMFIKSGWNPWECPTKRFNYIIQTDGTEYVDLQHSHLYHPDPKIQFCQNQDSQDFFSFFFGGELWVKHHPPFFFGICCCCRSSNSGWVVQGVRLSLRVPSWTELCRRFGLGTLGSTRNRRPVVRWHTLVVVRCFFVKSQWFL